MKKSLLLLPLLTLPVAAEVVLSYDAGVPAAAAETGADDPANQGWTLTNAAGNQYSDAYDSGDGGWRTIDGTSAGPANYSQSLDAAAQTKLVNSSSWTITWTVALDKDALGSSGGSVADYYLAPNNSRQNNLVALIDLAADGIGFNLTHRVDENDILLLEDVSGGSGTYNTGIDVSAFPNFATFSLTYDTTAGTAVLDYGGDNSGTTTVTINPGSPIIGGRNAIFFGAGTSGGQGSAVWNEFLVTIPDIGGGADLTWTGDNGSTWDLGTTVNWELPDTNPSTFANDDNATFDDTGATGTVTVSGAINPGSVTVDNDALAYTIGGDPLGGLGGLTKQGPGSLTLTSNQAYAGGTMIDGGTLTAGDGATSGEIGAGAVSIASGASLVISRSDLLDYKAAVKLRELSGEGDLVLDGGGLLFTYPGGGLGFNSDDTWAGFSGDITLTNGSELQTIRNGATGRGSGSLILGDGGSSGSLSAIEGNWTWTNPIEAVGPDNAIINRASGGDRSLKLQGAISGGGNLTFQDATSAMTDTNGGFVITNDVSLTGTLTIDSGVPVRIGGVPGEVDVSGTGLDADSSGSLGTTTVVNDGTLTFSRTDAHTIGSAISGFGGVRIGMPSAAGRGDTSTQVVTIADATKTYEGTTTVESGTLRVNGTLPNSLVDVNPEGTLGGTGTVGSSTLAYGNLAPGASVGTLTFGDELIVVGDASYTWEISDFTGSAGSGYDTLAASSIEFVEPLSLSDPITAANPVTIVVSPDSVANFSETTTTFTLATSATPITVIDLAAFVIDDSAFATATGSAGTWGVQLSGDSLALELVYTAGTPADDYADWIAGFPGVGAMTGFDEDPDGDGIDNGVENFLGTAPDVFNAGLTITGSTSTSVTATHTQTNDPASDVTGGYEWSSDLASWNASGDTDGNGVTATINAVVTDDQSAPDLDTVEVTATVTGGSSGRLFLRATATQTP